MRRLDALLTRALRGTVDAMVEQRVTAELDRRIEERKLDALYSCRWHGDRSRLHIPATAIVNNALFNMSGGEITLGEYVFFGHDVAVLTGTHDVHQFGKARQDAFPHSGRDVVIGEGAWLASHVLVLGPVTIGAHAVVAAGSLVREDVEPYAIVAGRPATLLKKIDPPTS